MDPARIDDVAPLFDPTALPRVLSRAEALRRGYSEDAIRHRLRTGRWRVVLPRTYLTSDTLTWDDRLRAASAFGGPRALLSGAAALDDLGLRSVRRPSALLVLVPSTTRVRSTCWVRIRRTARLPEVELRPGPRRAPVPRAVADLALELGRLDDVRALVADVVRRGLGRPEELERERLAGPRRGSAYLRQAIEEVAAGAWSAPEARAAVLLRRARPPAFEQNVRLRLSTGRVVVVDFLWRALRAVLEIDSASFHALAGDADATSDRHMWLEADGYSVAHRTPAQISRSPAAFVASVSAWLGGLAAARRS